MGVFVGAIVTIVVIYGAMELAYRMGEQTACAAQTSFYRQYAPALPSREQNTNHYVISESPVGGA